MSAGPKAILFDLDDTILKFGDRRQLGISVAEEFASHLGPFSATEVGDAIEEFSQALWANEANHKRWRFQMLEARIFIMESAFQTLRNRAPGLTPEIARQFGRRFHEIRDGDVACYPGALATLDEFNRRGVLLALVTNGLAESQRPKIERFDLQRRFKHIQIESEIGFGKPEERAYRYAMETLGVQPAETWMVGDNLEWEVAAPQRLGIYSVWHDHKGAGLPRNSPVRPDRIVQSISELLATACWQG